MCDRGRNLMGSIRFRLLMCACWCWYLPSWLFAEVLPGRMYYEKSYLPEGGEKYGKVSNSSLRQPRFVTLSSPFNQEGAHSKLRTFRVFVFRWNTVIFFANHKTDSTPMTRQGILFVSLTLWHCFFILFLWLSLIFTTLRYLTLNSTLKDKKKWEEWCWRWWWELSSTLPRFGLKYTELRK